MSTVRYLIVTVLGDRFRSPSGVRVSRLVPSTQALGGVLGRLDRAGF